MSVKRGDTEVLTVTVPVGWCNALTSDARNKGLNRSAYVRSVMLEALPNLGAHITKQTYFGGKNKTDRS